MSTLILNPGIQMDPMMTWKEGVWLTETVCQIWLGLKVFQLLPGKRDTKIQRHLRLEIGLQGCWILYRSLVLTYLKGSMYFNILSGYFFWSYFSLMFVDFPASLFLVLPWYRILVYESLPSFVVCLREAWLYFEGISFSCWCWPLMLCIDFDCLRFFCLICIYDLSFFFIRRVAVPFVCFALKLFFCHNPYSDDGTHDETHCDKILIYRFVKGVCAFFQE